MTNPNPDISDEAVRMNEELQAIIDDCDKRSIWRAVLIVKELTGQFASRDATIAKLRKALAPFRDMLKGNYSHQSDELPLDIGHGAHDLRFKIKLGDLRRIDAALNETEPK